MKRILIAACLCLAATTAQADKNWRGPGWYVEVYHYVAVIWSGPYGSRQACTAAIPVKITIGNYMCAYVDHNPRGTITRNRSGRDE